MNISHNSNTPEPVDVDLFWVHSVKGNISRCTGCAQRDLRAVNGKPHPPPHDLCLQHKEQVLFENPKTGCYQMSRDRRNVYYHAQLACVQRKFVDFRPHLHLKVSIGLLKILCSCPSIMTTFCQSLVYVCSNVL